MSSTAGTAQQSASGAHVTDQAASAASEHANQSIGSIGSTINAYWAARSKVVEDEAAIAFDNRCRMNSTRAEELANDVLKEVKLQDLKAVFGPAGKRDGHGGLTHDHVPGDHFLSNEHLINETKLLKVAKKVPKGAHLHIHFNSCLLPNVLLEIARAQPNMYIKSNVPLVLGKKENFFTSQIEFSILHKTYTEESRERVLESSKKTNGNITFSHGLEGNLFEDGYNGLGFMKFQEFLENFPSNEMKDAMKWLESKLVFQEKETHDIYQTAAGIWDRFNGRTRMMKGLFNYEAAYKTYTKLFLKSLEDDNIQYAEIRPNFMQTNQLWTNDGSKQLDNRKIMEIIVEACETFKNNPKRDPSKHFDGIKIIYCTPRSFHDPGVKFALDECIQFKKDWPNYIAGFDLVGEEAKGRPLKDHVPQLIEFQAKCKAAGVEIPFLFHCGETLDVGTTTDGNLVDALLLGSKRIGHGFALPRHPHIMAEMKKKGVCVEVCPISNEILGLTPRIGGHAVFSLLANNIPCTVNSDNGTLFKSTLSHDFYQVMVGKGDMTIYGVRQLAEWSLEHSCLGKDELAVAREQWLISWRKFIVWLLKFYNSNEMETKEETKKAIAEVLADIEAGTVEAAK